AYEIMKELGTNVQLLPNHSTPQKDGHVLQPQIEEAGIMGLQWAKHLRNTVKVTISDISEACVKMIRENCRLNHIRVDGASPGSSGPDEPATTDEDATAPITAVEVAKMDANVMMHLRSFDYIHLDPFGTTVNYLDAAFRNVRNLGIVSVTLHGHGLASPNVTLRHYGCHIVRTEYYKELAARMVVATVARGPSPADESAKRLRQLIHCQWSGPLFNTGFLRRMLLAAVHHSMEDIQPLVKTLICESECTTLKSFAHGPSALTNQVECGVVIKTLESIVKKLKSDASLEHPAFYYSIHRHSIKGLNMPKLNKFLQYLTEAGFRVSRTHFDPTGVRTDATLEQFKAVLTKYSAPSYASSAAANQASLHATETTA
ncbi:hypothetical protein CRUP_006454, partial [Coryphaenoides rupestris]